MQLTNSIKEAWAAVEESGVPDHMQELAFKEALRVLLGSTPQGNGAAAASGHSSTAIAREPARNESDSAGEERSLATEQEVVQRVSDDTGVPVQKLEQLFHIDEGTVKLVPAHAKLGSKISDKARNVAQIVTIVRKIGMGHADTSFDIIREACESKHCYDSKNFTSQHMPKIEGFVVKGDGKNRRLEAKNTGISSFPDLVDKVLGLA